MSQKPNQTFKNDLLASIVVFLVALPLSLGIAMASGAPMKAGIIGAVIGGIVVGLFSGSPLQVSGPAAGLTVIVYQLIEQHQFSGMLAMTFMAGLFQILFGVFGMASLALIISPAVIYALLAGIGILIMTGQFYVLCGSKPMGSFFSNIHGLEHLFQNLNQQALWLGVVSLAMIIAWEKLKPKKMSWLPSALLAVVFGTLASELLHLQVPKILLDKNIFSSFSLPHFSIDHLSTFIWGAFGLAVVASSESLLCATATDKLHSGERSQLGRELFAQGLGNVCSGLLGGLPLTGVIVRSSANISAGAKTRLSAILHGVWLLVFTLLFQNQLQLIPLPVLAALLIFTGAKLVKIKDMKLVNGYKEFLPYAVTLVGVVGWNMMIGIGAGLAVQIVILLIKLKNVRIELSNLDDEVTEVTFKGPLSFVCVPQLNKILAKIPNHQTVQMKFEINYLDHSAIESIRNWKGHYERLGGKVEKPSLFDIWRSL
jgi:carbonic anhydrase